jgi:hypothetical protein
MFKTRGNDAAIVVQAFAAECGKHSSVFQLNEDWSRLRYDRNFQDIARNRDESWQDGNFVARFDGHKACRSSNPLADASNANQFLYTEPPSDMVR